MYDEKSLQGIGNKIKLLRTLRRVSQQQLAKQLGISQTHMSNIEGGRVSVNLRLLMRIANLFECRLDDIISAFNEIGSQCSTRQCWREEVRLLLKMLQLTKNK
ncbi:helix-turn-helix transcriptional regulator [Phascolarctobacterium sp.]|uniref:helix-turn-helix transcriptional regulator n=1 Tax=Phascolarctobacterium sp. TaxID=2049039 RepID=UPI00306CB46C